MNLAHLHLILNHLPIIGFPVAAVILALGLRKNSQDLIKLGFYFTVFFGLVAVPTYFTGEPAEEIVEHLPGVEEGLIEEHEDAALISIILGGVTALLAAGLLLKVKNKTMPRGGALGLLALLVVTSGSLAWTGFEGGQIRHTEIRGTENATPSKS